MSGITLPVNFDGLCNSTYTTSNGENCNVDIAALMKIIADIPAIPKLFTMNIDIRRVPWLPENFILLSNSVADALEEAINKEQKCI